MSERELRAQLNDMARLLEALQAENVALRKIVQIVAGLEARQSEVWNELGLFHGSVNVLWLREQARTMLNKPEGGERG